MERIVHRPCNGTDIPGFRLVVLNLHSGEQIYLTEEWDFSPSSVFWNPDGSRLYVLAMKCGRKRIFESHLNGKIRPLFWSDDSSVVDAHISQNSLLITQSSLTDPYTVQMYSLQQRTLCRVFTPASKPPLTHHSVREFWYQGCHNRPIHGFLHLPEDFNESRTYPLVFLIHGGPQSAWEDAWSIRWNSAVFANAGSGWIVAMINPTGSTGYGQAFQDSIRGHWGSRPCSHSVYAF